MNTIKKIKEFDAVVSEVLDNQGRKLAPLLKSSSTPETLKSIFSFFAKTTEIRNAIYKLQPSKNLYAINILHRALIEHYLKLFYMYCRLLKEKNDAVGKDYMEFCSLYECNTLLSNMKNLEYLSEKIKNLNQDEFLRDFDSRFAKYTKKEIREKQEQFQYKNILKYINAFIKEGNARQIDDENRIWFSMNIIAEYAQLSSCTHGGPESNSTMILRCNKKELSLEIRKRIEGVFLMDIQISYMLFSAFYQENKKPFILTSMKKIFNVLKDFKDFKEIEV